MFGVKVLPRFNGGVIRVRCATTPVLDVKSGKLLYLGAYREYPLRRIH